MMAAFRANAASAPPTPRSDARTRNPFGFARLAAITAVVVAPVVSATAAPTASKPAPATSSSAPSGLPSAEVALGSSGESCTRTADCVRGFRCVANVCLDPALGTEGDACESAKDCNAHLKCKKQACVAKGTVAVDAPPPAAVSSASTRGDPAPGASPPDPDLAEPTPPPETPKRNRSNNLSPGLDGFRGFRTTMAIGAGGTENLGFALEFDIGFRFSDWVGVSAWFGRIAGGTVSVTGPDPNSSIGRTMTTSVDVGFTNYLVGLRLGKALHGELLLGCVNANGTSSSVTTVNEYSKGSLAYGLVGGYDIGLGGIWALTPRLMLLKPSESAVSDKMIFAGTIGLTIRVPRVND